MIQSHRPTPDVVIENHFSIFLVRPLSCAADQWIDEHVPEDAETWGDAIVVEHRYIEAIARGMFADGLVVRY